MADLIERDAAIDCLDSNAFDSYENAVMTLHKIEDIPAVNRWISVEDALPNNRKCVLVTDGENIEITYFDGSDWEMYDQYGNHYELYVKVTHWMPLPEPPEKE